MAEILPFVSLDSNRHFESFSLVRADGQTNRLRPKFWVDWALKITNFIIYNKLMKSESDNSSKYKLYTSWREIRVIFIASKQI